MVKGRFKVGDHSADWPLADSRGSIGSSIRRDGSRFGAVRDLHAAYGEAGDP